MVLRKMKAIEAFIGFLLVVLFPHISNGQISGSLGKGYKEPCNETDPCNGVKFLECQDGTCDCVSKSEIIFDSGMDQCLALAGTSCLRHIPGQTDENSPKYQIACVPHAKCSYPEDMCECDFRYFKGPDNKCLKQKGYNEKCAADDQCDKYPFFSCIGGTCTCDKNHLYDRKNDRCIVTVGSECTIFDFRTITEEHYQGDECPEDASCHPSAPNTNKGICHCKPGFKLASDRTCGRDWGDECGLNQKCSDVQFICKNGTCQCKYPMHQYFDEETRACVSLAGGPCDSTPNGLTKCTENAQCHEESPHNYCRCIMGYIEDNDGKCVKAYGTACELDEECDPIPDLACIDNICSCPDKLQLYNDKARMCISLVGGRCRKDANMTAAVCPQNAYCVKSSPQLHYGRCLCAKGMSTTVNRLCTKGQ